METTDCWYTLKLNPQRDVRRIRRAYAELLKLAHPTDSPQAFLKLRAAYEEATYYALFDESLPNKQSASPDETPLNTPLKAKIETDSLLDELGFPPRNKSSPDIPRIRDDNERSAHHLEKLYDRLSYESEESAIHYLYDLLKSPEMGDLIMRSKFERMLMQTLALIVPFPEQLARNAFTIFDWETRLRQPHDCYLGAVQFLLDEEKSIAKYNELHTQAQRTWTREGKLARALAGPYAPWYFRWFIMSEPRFNLAQSWFQEFKSQYPYLLSFGLDPKTARWWTKATATTPLFFRHYIAILALSGIATFFASVFNQLFSWDLTNSFFGLVGTFAVITAGVSLGVYVAVFIHRRYGTDWRQMLKAYFDNRLDWFAFRSMAQLAVVLLLIVSLLFTLAAEGRTMILLAFISHALLFLVFRASLFFYIQFIAIMLQFIYRDQAWFQQMAASNKFHAHVFCVIDVVLTYIVLYVTLRYFSRALGQFLGIKENPTVNRPLLELSLMTVVMIGHFVVFSARRV